MRIGLILVRESALATANDEPRVEARSLGGPILL
jgi:hypothetical protein